MWNPGLEQPLLISAAEKIIEERNYEVSLGKNKLLRG